VHIPAHPPTHVHANTALQLTIVCLHAAPDDRRQSFGSVLGKVFEEDDDRDALDMSHAAGSSDDACPPRKVFDEEIDFECQLDMSGVGCPEGYASICDISAVVGEGMQENERVRRGCCDVDASLCDISAVERSVNEVEAAVNDISIDSDCETEH
jgi:hypothetical protein